jgi:hypothetical protein
MRLRARRVRSKLVGTRVRRQPETSADLQRVLSTFRIEARVRVEFACCRALPSQAQCLFPECA